MSSLSVYVHGVAGVEPSETALRLLQLLRLSESDVEQVQNMINVLCEVERHALLREWVEPGCIKGVAEPGKRVEDAIRDYMAQSPKASTECRALFDSTPFPESEEFLGLEAFVDRLPTLAMTDTYRWLRQHWNTPPAFGGGEPGKARRDKTVEHLKVLGLEKEEVDAAEDDVDLPDVYFDERSKLDAPGRLRRINEYRRKEGTRLLTS